MGTAAHCEAYLGFLQVGFSFIYSVHLCLICSLGAESESECFTLFTRVGLQRALSTLKVGFSMHLGMR